MEAYLGPFFFALGAILASFISVIAERINTGHSFVHGRSRCDACNRTLSGFDLVPILSWFFARGKCRTCGSKIPVRLVLSEIIMGAVFLGVYLRTGLSAELPLLLAAVCVLAFIVIYDLRHTLVPPSASFLLCVLAVVHAMLRFPDVSATGYALLSGGLVALFFWLLHVLSKGRAMGLGDAPVAFSLATIVSPYAFSGLLYSFWIGAVFGIIVLLLRRGGPRMGIEVPFVPFLALGFLLAYFIQWNLLL